MSFKPPTIGEVRGPWRSSPGNPKPWQAAAYVPNGWVYTFGKTGKEVLEGAHANAKRILKDQSP
jgi:hypothetical protein